MKRARVAYAGAIHEATPHARGAAAGRRPRAGRGRGRLAAAVRGRHDHRARPQLRRPRQGTRLQRRQDEPLVFLKGPGALIGHRGQTRRPADATFMHYECELAVVIGATARNVDARRRDAHVAGYTVANDYAIRDYLENWYRPNLRVKNRDGCTVLGPWLVDAADVRRPACSCALRTIVNGKVTQQRQHRATWSSTSPALIEYLSGFMTLSPGDVILTGTPDGVVERRGRRRGRHARSTASAGSSTPSSATPVRTTERNWRSHANPAPDRRPRGRGPRLLRDRQPRDAGGARRGRRAAATPRSTPRSPRPRPRSRSGPALPATERAQLMRRLGDLIAAHVPEISRDRDARHRPGDRPDAASSWSRARPTTSTTSPRCARASTATPTRRRRT